MKRTLTTVIFLIAVLLVSCQANPAEELTKTTAMDYDYPWWNDVTFYQVFVRSFYDSDGDGIGDINGLIEKLDYLNDGDPATDTDLEVTGLWLMPMLPSPSYHGYDVTDYQDIEPDYGSLEEFERLLEECHKRGMYVIIDWEINHTSTEHPWFEAARDPDSEYHDWYIWVKEEPDFLGPWGQDVWHRSLETGMSYYGIFWEGMPDLNYENPEVTAAMEDAVAFWIDTVGVDGLRIDGARHLIEEGQKQQNTESTHEWYQDFYVWYNELDPDMMTIGEVWDSSASASQFVQGEEMDMVFDFDLASKLVESAASGYGLTVGKAIEGELRYFPDFQMGTFLTNHDMPRTMSEVREDYGKAKSAATALLTAPGVPFIYYGEEIGMSGGKPDENIRRPMQWDDTDYAGFSTATPWKLPQRDYADKNVLLQNEDEDSLLNHYRRLINLRNEYPALKIGDYFRITASDAGIYAALRQTEEENILILANMSEEPISDYTLNLKDGTFTGSYKVFDLFNGENLKAANLVANDEGGFTDYVPFDVLEPYTTYILWLDN